MGWLGSGGGGGWAGFAGGNLTEVEVTDGLAYFDLGSFGDENF